MGVEDLELIKKTIIQFVFDGKADVLVYDIVIEKSGRMIQASFDIALTEGGRRMHTNVLGKDAKQLLHKVFRFLKADKVS